MEDNYKKIEVLKYVKEGLKNGTLVPQQAEKFARIIARQGTVGEQIVTWSVDEAGKPIQEKVGTVELDEKTGKPGWIATKVDEAGKPIIDTNGHSNDWIIDDSTFIKKYELDPANTILFRPKGGIQVFVQINENIALKQWGEEMQIAAGGYINITDPDDMYGISKRDFDDTYKVVEKVNQK